MRNDVRLGWIKDTADPRDYIFHRKLAPTALPHAVDLTTMFSVPVVDQGQLGSCTGNGIASALAYLELKEGAPLVYPSRLFIYYNERVIEGSINDDAGAEIRDGIKTVVAQGFCPETDWPYDISKFAVHPSANAYADALRDLVKTYQRVPVDATSIMTALANGYAVIVGFTVYDSFYNNSDGTIDLPGSNDRVVGGHCVIVVGYDQVTSKFKFQNSWGTGWGTNGFGTIPFEYLGDMRYGGDYWIVTGDQSVAPPTPNPTPQPSPVPFGGCLLSLFLLPIFLIVKILNT